MLGKLKQAAKQAASNIKNKLQPDDLDKQLTQAVSDQNWQASTQLLHDIAAQAYQAENQQRILAFVWEKIKHKQWKKVLKTLHMVDFLLKNGPNSTVNSLKQHVYEFRCLDSYSNHSDGLDRGEAVRKQAKAIVDLMADDSRLNDERAQAKQIKDRMSNVLGTSSKYGSFSSSGDWKSQREGSQIYHSTQFQSSTNSNTQMSFGESVMKSLQKKQDRPPEPTPQPVEIKPAVMMKGPSVTTGVTNQAKKEEKTSFGSMNMKLVKPPEKKPGSQKQKEILKGMNVKPQPKGPQKAQPKTDIMDFDFGAAGAQPVAQPQGQDAFDLLGGVNAQPATQPPVETSPSKPGNITSDLLFSTPSSVTPPVPGPSVTAPPQISGPSPPNTLNMNWNATYNQPPAQSAPPSNTAQITLNSAQNSAPQPPATNKASSLIDFSNFREELGSLPKQKPADITSGWNW